MKKAVLLSALLFSFLISYSSHLPGSEIFSKAGTNTGFQFAVNSDMPGDTISYLYLDQVSNTLYLSVTLDNPAKISVMVLDILGTEVWTLPETTYDSGKQLLSGALNLNNGQYIVKVLKNGAVCKTQKIFVIK